MRTTSTRIDSKTAERLTNGLHLDSLQTFTAQLCNKMPRVNDAFWRLEAVTELELDESNSMQKQRYIERIHPHQGSDVQYRLCRTPKIPLAERQQIEKERRRASWQILDLMRTSCVSRGWC
jgi:hypothetical protein